MVPHTRLDVLIWISVRMTHQFKFFCRAAASSNKQLQRTVIPNRWRAASAPFHYAHAARWIGQCAAAELRR